MTKTIRRCAVIGELIGGLFAILVAISCGCSSATLAAGISADDADKGARSATSAKPDAEFLLWSQHWTLNEDKSTSYREHWQVRINDGRAIGRFGDPRISHVKGSDKLTIHKAQTTLPNGEVLPVPDYSFNIAATDEVAGWPEYADWQDMIVSFSGIENGAVVELDYEIVSPAGTWPWFDGLVRLNDVYPIAKRVLTVTVPEKSPLFIWAGGGPIQRGISPSDSVANGNRTVGYVLTNVEGERDEPLSLPWPDRTNHLIFSNCPRSLEPEKVDTWREPFAAAVMKAAKGDKSIERFARNAIENEVDPIEKARKVAKKMRDSFNYVESPKAFRGLACRDASVILGTNYGNQLESAALLYASLASVGLDCSLRVVVDAEEYHEIYGAPPSAALEGVIVKVSTPDREILLHPKLGEITNPGAWGHKLIMEDPIITSKVVIHQSIEARGDSQFNKTSDIQISGKVTIDKDAKASGDLRIRADGAFLNNDVFNSSDSQKKWLGGVVDRVLTGFEVSSFSVRELENDNFVVTCKVATKDAFKKPGGRYLVGLGTGPVTLNAINFPLERSERQSDVRVGTTIKEEVQISIELPDGWTGLMTEQPFDAKDSAWGSVNEGLSQEKNSIRFARTLSIEKDQLTPTAFLSMREALNELRSNRRRVMLLKEKSEAGQLAAQDGKPK